MLELIAALIAELPPGDTRRDLEIRRELLALERDRMTPGTAHTDTLNKRIDRLYRAARKATE